MQRVFNRGGINTTVGSNQPNPTSSNQNSQNKVVLTLFAALLWFGQHTIEAPVGVAVFVANGNGKPAIVGSYH